MGISTSERRREIGCSVAEVDFPTPVAFSDQFILLPFWLVRQKMVFLSESALFGFAQGRDSWGLPEPAQKSSEEL